MASFYWNIESYIQYAFLSALEMLSFLDITFILLFDSLFLISSLKLQNIFISPGRWQVYDVHLFMIASTGIEYWKGGTG